MGTGGEADFDEEDMDEGDEDEMEDGNEMVSEDGTDSDNGTDGKDGTVLPCNCFSSPHTLAHAGHTHGTDASQLAVIEKFDGIPTIFRTDHQRP